MTTPATSKEWRCDIVSWGVVDHYQREMLAMRPSVNRNVWKVVNAKVVEVDGLPPLDKIGKQGRVTIGKDVFKCALVRVSVVNENTSVEAIGHLGHIYVQGPTEIDIEFLILEDRWPNAGARFFEFTWEDK